MFDGVQYYAAEKSGRFIIMVCCTCLVCLTSLLAHYNNPDQLYNICLTRRSCYSIGSLLQATDIYFRASLQYIVSEICKPHMQRLSRTTPILHLCRFKNIIKSPFAQ